MASFRGHDSPREIIVIIYRVFRKKLCSDTKNLITIKT